MGTGFILEKLILEKVEKECRAQSWSSQFVNYEIDSNSVTINLDASELLFLVSDEIDIPATAKVKIISADNIIQFSKKDYEFNKSFENECFRIYLKVTTTNYGINFIPYKLKFLKVTPI